MEPFPGANAVLVVLMMWQLPVLLPDASLCRYAVRKAPDLAPFLPHNQFRPGVTPD
jgi:hypothetical protein